MYNKGFIITLSLVCLPLLLTEWVRGQVEPSRNDLSYLVWCVLMEDLSVLIGNRITIVTYTNY